jgi:hypothetical protein
LLRGEVGPTNDIDGNAVMITRTTDSSTITPLVTIAEADNLNAAGVATITGNPGVALNNVTVAVAQWDSGQPFFFDLGEVAFVSLGVVDGGCDHGLDV